MKEHYYEEKDVKCRLIAYEKCSKTTITFFYKHYTVENYNRVLTELKMNINISKIIKVEKEEEEIIFEKQNLNK